METKEEMETKKEEEKMKEEEMWLKRGIMLPVMMTCVLNWMMSSKNVKNHLLHWRTLLSRSVKAHYYNYFDFSRLVKQSFIK